MKTLYIETSVVSFLRSKTSTHIVSAARQILTQTWWNQERHNYQLVTSQFVLDEAAQGAPNLAAERLVALQEIPLLDTSDDIIRIAEEFLVSAVLPPQAKLDALHIATATFHGIDYLLTWNCTHIANARILPSIHAIIRRLGYSAPTICTPEALLDDDFATN